MKSYSWKVIGWYVIRLPSSHNSIAAIQCKVTSVWQLLDCTRRYGSTNPSSARYCPVTRTWRTISSIICATSNESCHVKLSHSVLPILNAFPTSLIWYTSPIDPGLFHLPWNGSSGNGKSYTTSSMLLSWRLQPPQLLQHTVIPALEIRLLS